MPRNAQGQYFLPDGNPVVPGELIKAEWANSTMDDIANAITESLDRAGYGGMTAPLKCFAGTAGRPGITFVEDVTSGLYKKSNGVVSAVAAGVEQAYWSSNGLFAPAVPTTGPQVANKTYVDNAIAAIPPPPPSFAIGMIMMFAASATLPAGWHICNGQNGTVNLIDKFIVAAGSKFAAGSTGGSFLISASQMPLHSHTGTTGDQSQSHTHTYSASTTTDGAHTHGVSDPGHVHSTFYASNSGYGAGGSGTVVASPYTGNTAAAATGISVTSAGSAHQHTFGGTTADQNQGHTHSFTTGGAGGSQEYIQPYYALIFAQYTGV